MSAVAKRRHQFAGYRIDGEAGFYPARADGQTAVGDSGAAGIAPATGRPEATP